MKELFIKKLMSLDKNRVLDYSLISVAYDFAFDKHQGQTRKVGNIPYIVHPIGVALSIASYTLDTELICAALLHDTVEDTPTTFAEIEELFGTTIRFLVEAVTTIFHEDRETMITLNKERMLAYGKKDNRVFILRTFDQLHNLSTLHLVNEKTQKSICMKVKIAYAEYARLGGLEHHANKMLEIVSRYES